MNRESWIVTLGEIPKLMQRKDYTLKDGGYLMISDEISEEQIKSFAKPFQDLFQDGDNDFPVLEFREFLRSIREYIVAGNDPGWQMYLDEWLKIKPKRVIKVTQ